MIHSGNQFCFYKLGMNPSFCLQTILGNIVCNKNAFKLNYKKY